MVKRWASGEGDVSPETRMRAVADVEQWEDLKARAAAWKADVRAASSSPAALQPSMQPEVLAYVRAMEAELAAARRKVAEQLAKPAVPADVIAYIEAMEDERDALRARLQATAPQRVEEAPLRPEVVAYVESLEDEADALRAALEEVDPENTLLVGEDPADDLPK